MATHSAMCMKVWLTKHTKKYLIHSFLGVNSVASCNCKKRLEQFFFKIPPPSKDYQIALLAGLLQELTCIFSKV